MKKNIRYKSKQILEFYRSNRSKWGEFYPSERWVFKKIVSDNKGAGDVLDVGCACGGLGKALCEKFRLKSYTGIDINREAIRWANSRQKLTTPSKFIYGDIVKMRLGARYDMVVSLGCADWNIETKKIIRRCWENVKPGGYLVISLRLTDKKGVNDIKRSYQYINFSGKEKKPETANYVVLNLEDALGILKELKSSPCVIGSYGYWGKPSSTASTPFKKIVFSVFYAQKGSNKIGKIKTEINLPI